MRRCRFDDASCNSFDLRNGKTDAENTQHGDIAMPSSRIWPALGVFFGVLSLPGCLTLLVEGEAARRVVCDDTQMRSGRLKDGRVAASGCGRWLVATCNGG